MRIGKSTPILRIFDQAKAREFYLEFLGFTLAWEHRFAPDLPLYLEVRRDDCVLHLSEHYGDASPGAAVRIDVSDLEAFHGELRAKDCRYARPEIESMPWGTRDMAIKDPFGNRLIFTSPAPVASGPTGPAK